MRVQCVCVMVCLALLSFFVFVCLVAVTVRAFEQESGVLFVLRAGFFAMKNHCTLCFFFLQTRAVQAETLVTKLKLDVKTLQGQVAALTAENEALVSGDRGLSDIRDRTKYASEQLASAAVTAEKNLR